MKQKQYRHALRIHKPFHQIGHILIDYLFPYTINSVSFRLDVCFINSKGGQPLALPFAILHWPGVMICFFKERHVNDFAQFLTIYSPAVSCFWFDVIIIIDRVFLSHLRGDYFEKKFKHYI
jgi:hypothetical protein